MIVSAEDAPFKSSSIVPQFFGALHADCRISKLVDEHPSLASFGDALTQFNLELWGCSGDGVSDFALMDGATELSAADAAILVELYVERMTLVLQLPPSYEKELATTLTCLAESAITNPSTADYTFSACADGGVDGSDGSMGTDAAEAGMSDSDVDADDGGGTD